MILEYVLLAIIAVLGLIYTFWGYKNLKKLVAIGAALTTFTASLSITMDLGILPSVIISVVAAIAAAILAHFFFNVGLFFLGAGLGLIFAMMISLIIPVDSLAVDIVIAVLMCVLFGILALKCKRVYLSASTAFTGASSLCGSIALILISLTKKLPDLKSAFEALDEYSLYLGIASAVLGLAGFIVQLAITAPRDK